MSVYPHVLSIRFHNTQPKGTKSRSLHGRGIIKWLLCRINIRNSDANEIFRVISAFIYNINNYNNIIDIDNNNGDSSSSYINMITNRLFYFIYPDDVDTTFSKNTNNKVSTRMIISTLNLDKLTW